MDNHSNHPTQPHPQQQSPTPARKSRRKLQLSVIIGATIIAVAAVAVYVIFIKSASPTDDPTTIGRVTQSNQKSDGVSIASLGEAYDGFATNGVKDFTASKKQATLDAYAALTDDFEFSDTFPDSKSSMLASLGIAYLYTDDKAHKDNYRNELYQLSSAHLAKLPTGISDDAFTRNTQSPAKTIATFKKYQDNELTTSIENTIASSGLARDVAKSLKLPGVDALAKYKAVVMDFEGTSARQQAFAAEHYMYGSTPKMWAEEVDGDIYILFAKDYAMDFIADPSGSLRSSVMHEFIHAQNPFVLGDLGRTIEERRAEQFSGNLSSYYDAKQLFIYSEVFSGISLIDMLNDAPTNPDDFYLNLYATFGVETANKIVASGPSVFLSEPSPSVASVQELTGGMDGVMKDMISIGKKDQRAMDQRINDRIDTLLEVFGSKERIKQDIDTNLADTYGMPSAASAIKRAVESR